MKALVFILLFPLLLLLYESGRAQTLKAVEAKTDSAQQMVKKGVSEIGQLKKLPSGYLAKANKRVNKYDKQITKRTTKALKRLQKQEARINKKLSKVDSLANHNFLTHSIDSLQHLRSLVSGKASKLTSKLGGGTTYVPYLDTLKNSLNFLDKYKDQVGKLKDMQSKLQSSMDNVNQLQGKLQQVQNIQQYIQQQQQLLSGALKKYGATFGKQLGKISKESYYYRAQLKNYKEMLHDPDKIEAEAVTILNKVPAFHKYMQEHSQLASLFRMPGNYGNTASLQGLQTRSEVESEIQQQLSGASNQARQQISQQMQAAKSKLNELKDKLPGGGSTAEMPDFKPKPLKSKTFLQRIEFGANMQNNRGTGILPATSDLAGQIAYKLSKKSNIGIGASYKLGWGQDIRHISLSSEGMGLRSFADFKLKYGIYINGGFEENYYSSFRKLKALYDLSTWKGSALLGLSKKYKISNKVKGNLMLLYDFLHNYHVPATQPFVFRLGYEFK